jgi:hypothetical protein
MSFLKNIKTAEQIEAERKEAAINAVEAQRLAAYANPLSGSDRHFAKSARLEAVGDTSGAEAARTAGLARYNEIRTIYQWPDDADE